MNTQSGFASHIQGFAFLSALFLVLVSVAPSAMAKEGTLGTHAIAAQDSGEPGCD